MRMLTSGEKMYWWVVREGMKQGLKAGEIHKARQAIGVKKRSEAGICYLSIEAGQREKAIEKLKELWLRTKAEPISNDWVRVISEEGDEK